MFLDHWCVISWFKSDVNSWKLKIIKHTTILQSVTHSAMCTINSQVDVIYTNLSKTFDMRGLYILTKSIKLMFRSQHIEVYGFKSTEHVATSGVFQGSCFGLLVFLIFIATVFYRLMSSWSSLDIRKCNFMAYTRKFSPFTIQILKRFENII